MTKLLPILTIAFFLIFSSSVLGAVVERENHRNWMSYVEIKNESVIAHAENKIPMDMVDGAYTSFIFNYSRLSTTPTAMVLIHIPGESHAYEGQTTGKIQVDNGKIYDVSFSMSAIGENFYANIIPFPYNELNNIIKDCIKGNIINCDLQGSNGNYIPLEFSLIGFTAAHNTALQKIAKYSP